MNWEECLQNNHIRETLPDANRAQSMQKMALFRLKFWKKQSTSPLKVEAYYEIIRELGFAHMYKKGYNCSNHICLIPYLEKYLDAYETQKVNELRQVRNEINYRGFSIPDDYLMRNEMEFSHIIDKLIELLR